MSPYKRSDNSIPETPHAEPNTPHVEPKTDSRDQETVERLSRCRGAMLFVGDADTGKTTLIGRVARAALEQGVVVAIVDSDVGQSNIGPPCAIGMKIFREIPEQFRVRRPDGLSFVGSIQPFGFFLEMVAGVCDLARQATEAGAGMVLVDTSGMPPSLGAFRLKQEKLLRLRPEHLVLIERGRELHPLAQLGESCSFCTVHRAPTSPNVHVKPTSLRRGHRKRMFSEYFQGTRTQPLSLAGMGVMGASLFAGRPLSTAARLRVAEFLDTPILRAELTGERLSVVCVRAPSRNGVGVLEQRFPKLQVRVYTPDILRGLLAGLEDGSGSLLDLAIVQSCDFTNSILNLISPFTDMNAVRRVRFGALRLKPDGTEGGTLRPGDV